MEQNLLLVNNLRAWFYTSDGIVKAVDDVSFSVKRGETLALVGESGSGKSVTAFSITGLVPPPGKIAGGEISLNGIALTKLSNKQMRSVRGKKVSMVFQEPMTSLNPVLTVGEQISEVFRRHEKLNRKSAKEKSVGMIKMAGIPRAEVVYGYYPHMLSGGMRQRVMIAMALSCDPELLIADEPTTALDVTIQAQILELMDALIRKRGKSMILITHDLGVVAEAADNVIVMYAGKAVEKASVTELFSHPSHPYTAALLASLPDMQSAKKTLYSIPGAVPNLLELPAGCAFCPRCSLSVKKCENTPPALVEISDGHFVSCHHAEAKERRHECPA
jgi:oligopeptide/dipeptide ABC transporter ATP-binding protein